MEDVATDLPGKVPKSLHPVLASILAGEIRNGNSPVFQGLPTSFQFQIELFFLRHDVWFNLNNLFFSQGQGQPVIQSGELEFRLLVHMLSQSLDRP